MRCHACDLALDADDNYCRKCGAPVRVLSPAAFPERTEVVRIGPAAPALLAGAARPLATGAAAVAAGALVRFAVRRAIRGIAGGAASRALAGPAAPTRALTRREEPAVTPRPSVQVTEVYWYRRIVRS